MDKKINVNINSIKSLYITIMYDNINLASATGFIVNNQNSYYLITNRHVVTGRNNETEECLDKQHGAIPNKLKVWLPFNVNNMGIHWSETTIELFDKENNELWLEHPFYKGKIDVVAIKLNGYNQPIFSYLIDSNGNSSVTDKVYIIGYPFGFNVSNQGKYAIWSTGIIASDPDLNLNINREQLPAFLVDAKTRSGQSGSPVIYHSTSGIDLQNGEFTVFSGPVTYEIGIYSGRINKDSDLGYVWKWSLIREIIQNK